MQLIKPEKSRIGCSSPMPAPSGSARLTEHWISLCTTGAPDLATPIFFQFEALMHSDAPHIGCTRCGKTTQLEVPWTRPGSHFTLMFEALTLTPTREMPIAVCVLTLGCVQNSLWRLINAYATRAREQESYAQVSEPAVDETACPWSTIWTSANCSLPRPVVGHRRSVRPLPTCAPMGAIPMPFSLPAWWTRSAGRAASRCNCSVV